MAVHRPHTFARCRFIHIMRILQWFFNRKWRFFNRKWRFFNRKLTCARLLKAWIDLPAEHMESARSSLDPWFWVQNSSFLVQIQARIIIVQYGIHGSVVRKLPFVRLTRVLLRVGVPAPANKHVTKQTQNQGQINQLCDLYLAGGDTACRCQSSRVWNSPL